MSDEGWDIPEDETKTYSFPCGCQVTFGMVDGQQAMVMQACKRGERCKWVKATRKTIEEEGKELQITYGVTEGVVVTCPFCGHVNNAVTPIHGDAALPTPGAIALCATCGELGVYDRQYEGGDIFIRLPTGEELVDMRQYEPLMEAQRAMKEAIQQHG